MSNAPHFHIDVPAFCADRYPALTRMRKEAPIAFVPHNGVERGQSLLPIHDSQFRGGMLVRDSDALEFGIGACFPKQKNPLDIPDRVNQRGREH